MVYISHSKFIPQDHTVHSVFKKFWSNWEILRHWKSVTLSTLTLMTMLRPLWIPSQLRTTTIRWLAHPTGLEYECYRSFQKSSLFSKHENLYSVSNIQETFLEDSIIWQRKKWPYSQSRHSSYFYNLKHWELGMQLRGECAGKKKSRPWLSPENCTKLKPN